MKIAGEWEIPVGGTWPLGFNLKGDDLPENTHIDSVAVTSQVPVTGLTVTAPVPSVPDADGFTFTATAATAGGYSIVFAVTRSDGAVLPFLGHIQVVAAAPITTLATNALVTVEQLGALLSPDETISKTRAEFVINSVSQEFERFCGRILKQVTYATTTKLYFDGDGTKYLQLPSWPAASVTGVYEDDVLLAEGDDDDYLVYTSDDSAYLARVGGTWAKGRKNIYITSVALGYATIPGDIVLACLKQCSWEYQRAVQKAWGETSRSVPDGGSVSLVDPGLLPDVEAVLKRYRRFGL